MVDLSLTVVDHGPALSRLDGERLGVAVAWLRHLLHRPNGRCRLPLGRGRRPLCGGCRWHGAATERAL